MFMYIFAKYLVYKRVQNIEISIEIVFLILTISLLLSISQKFWNWFREHNYTKETTKIQEFYYDSGKIFNADECPICVSQPVNAVQTNCGHCFCGLCFQQFFKVTQIGVNRFKCPLCRQAISSIKRHNKENDKTIANEEKIDKFIKEYHFQFNCYKRATQLKNITPWLCNLIIGSLFLLMIMFINNIISSFV